MPLAQFKIAAHNFFVTEQAENEIYVYIRREFRTFPLLGMKMPTPQSAFLGMDTVLVVKHKGQPAIEYSFSLLKDNIEIQAGYTNHLGMFHGLDIIFADSVCECDPARFKNHKSNKKKDSNLNLRCCKKNVPIYTLEINERQMPSFDDGAPSDNSAILEVESNA